MQLFKIVFKIFHLRGPSASKFYIQPEIHFSNFLAALYIFAVSLQLQISDHSIKSLSHVWKLDLIKTFQTHRDIFILPNVFIAIGCKNQTLFTITWSKCCTLNGSTVSYYVNFRKTSLFISIRFWERERERFKGTSIFIPHQFLNILINRNKNKN